MIGDTMSSVIASIVNAVQIYVFNYLYGVCAESLTQRENHRTDSEHEDALVGKYFVFQFVNSYSSFFYIAFVAEHMPKPQNAAESDVGEY